MNYEYIFSGPGFLRLKLTLFARQNKELCDIIVQMIKGGLVKLREDVLTNPSENFPLFVSLLFNAYTEKQSALWIRENDNFCFENIYADSGGLQMILTGKVLKSEMKQEIYRTQSISDYAMCFDEIPCETLIANSNRTSRGNPATRVYIASKAKDCAERTADNIMEQIEFLSSIKSKTKVFYIVQGNTIEDMVEWFNIGVEKLESWHWDHIGGLAVADTCMGTGNMESIDMLVAYHQIYKIFERRYTKHHLHLLGFGSAERLAPMLYLKSSGFLDKDVRISFDSSKFSMGYVMGRFMGSDGIVVNSHFHRTREVFAKITDYFLPVYDEFYAGLDREEIVDTLYRDCMAPTGSGYHKNIPSRMMAIILANKTLSVCWQILGFSKKMKKQQDAMLTDISPIGLLQNVTNFDDYKRWKSKYSYLIPSKRVKREQSNLSVYFA